MDAQQNDLNMFQKNLNNDVDLKRSFIANDDICNSDEDEEDACKIIFPTRSKRTNNDTSQELLFQLLKQTNSLSKTREKMYELQSEIDREEIITRYIKLDLNNAQVSFDEKKDELKLCNNKLKDALIENWVMRASGCAYIILHLYLYIFTN
jgi:septum formation topological specificity factor MinE